MSPHSTTDEVQAWLRAQFNGRAVLPGDPGYDSARSLFYGGFDRYPAAVVRPADAHEVGRIVRATRDSGLPLAVRGGGHSLAGHSVVDDGIVLDLSGMRSIDVDVAGRTAWAGGGTTAGAYTVAAGAHGLATGFGDTGSVGVAGITLGGGVGFLTRRFGLTIDSLLAAEVVTADGEPLVADPESHPDLFWAIRGGGGNFGVVTRLRFRLYEVPAVVGGLLVLPATADAIRSFVEEAQAAPEELTTIANIATAPPMPMLPAELHGSLVLMAQLCYAGDTDAGLRAVAPFRALATPIVDTVGPMPYTGLFQGDGPPGRPTVVTRTMFVDTIGKEEAETIVDRLSTSDAPFRGAQIRVLGGAVSGVPADATAYAHRSSPIMVNVTAAYGRPDDRAATQAWAAEFTDALRQRDTGAYVNFLEDEGAERVRDAYPPATWRRLVAVKRRYDPTNLFRSNHNVPPTA